MYELETFSEDWEFYLDAYLNSVEVGEMSRDDIPLTIFWEKKKEFITCALKFVDEFCAAPTKGSGGRMLPRELIKIIVKYAYDGLDFVVWGLNRRIVLSIDPDPYLTIHAGSRGYSRLYDQKKRKKNFPNWLRSAIDQGVVHIPRGGKRFDYYDHTGKKVVYKSGVYRCESKPYPHLVIGVVRLLEQNYFIEIRSDFVFTSFAECDHLYPKEKCSSTYRYSRIFAIRLSSVPWKNISWENHGFPAHYDVRATKNLTLYDKLTS